MGGALGCQARCRKELRPAGRVCGRPKRKDGHGGKIEVSGRFLEPPAATAAISSATTAAVAPAAPTTVEPAAATVVAVVGPVVLAAVVATSAEEPVVAGAGTGARVRSVSPPTAGAAATYEVRDDAKDYTYPDHEQDNQKQFHGMILPVDAPGYKVVFYPYASLGYNSAGLLCVRARVVY